MIAISHGAIICVLMLCFVMVHYCEVVEIDTMIENTRDFDDSFERNDLNANELDMEFEPRKDKSAKGKQELLAKILPMLATPFIVQATFLPMMLLGIKFMLLQSIFMGKLAIIFWAVNLIRNTIKDKQGQLYSHNVHLPQH